MFSLKMKKQALEMLEKQQEMIVRLSAVLEDAYRVDRKVMNQASEFIKQKKYDEAQTFLKIRVEALNKLLSEPIRLQGEYSLPLKDKIQ